MAMQRLQGLCEKIIMSHLKLANVIPMLAKAAEAQYHPVKHACYKLLAIHKPASDPAFSPRLIAALSSDPGTLATAVTAISGTLPVVDTSLCRFTEIPPSQLPHAMASLWERANDASQDSNASSGTSKSMSSPARTPPKKRAASGIQASRSMAPRRLLLLPQEQSIAVNLFAVHKP